MKKPGECTCVCFSYRKPHQHTPLSCESAKSSLYLEHHEEYQTSCTKTEIRFLSPRLRWTYAPWNENKANRVNSNTLFACSGVLVCLSLLLPASEVETIGETTRSIGSRVFRVAMQIPKAVLHCFPCTFNLFSVATSTVLGTHNIAPGCWLVWVGLLVSPKCETRTPRPKGDQRTDACSCLWCLFISREMTGPHATTNCRFDLVVVVDWLLKNTPEFWLLLSKCCGGIGVSMVRACWCWLWPGSSSLWASKTVVLRGVPRGCRSRNDICFQFSWKYVIVPSRLPPPAGPPRATQILCLCTCHSRWPRRSNCALARSARSAHTHTHTQCSLHSCLPPVSTFAPTRSPHTFRVWREFCVCVMSDQEYS